MSTIRWQAFAIEITWNLSYRDNLESNSEVALGYLDSLSSTDTNLYVEYQVDEDNPLLKPFFG